MRLQKRTIWIRNRFRRPLAAPTRASHRIQEAFHRSGRNRNAEDCEASNPGMRISIHKPAVAQKSYVQNIQAGQRNAGDCVARFCLWRR